MQCAPTFCLQVALLLLQAAACLLLMDDLLVWRFQFVSIVLLVTIAFFIAVMGQIRFSVACFIISHHILEACCKFCDCFEKMNPSSLSIPCRCNHSWLFSAKKMMELTAAEVLYEAKATENMVWKLIFTSSILMLNSI